MRVILFFITGFLSCFFLGELINRFSKRFNYSLIGLFLLLLGFGIGFFGQTYFFPPLNSLIAIFLLGGGSGLIIHHVLSLRYIIAPTREQQFFKKHESLVERICETIPGSLVWIALTSPFWLSLTLPFAVAYLLLLADAYWLLSSLRAAVMIFLAYRKMEWAKKQDWLKKLDQDFSSEWKSYYHLFVLPIFKENFTILEPAIQAIFNSDYPKDKLYLAIGFEDWSPKENLAETKKFLAKYKNEIGGIFLTIHKLQEGEIKGPGTNRNWMVKNAVKEFTKKGVEPQQVIVTTLDADFVIHSKLHSGMLYKYLSIPSEQRLKRSLTGAFLYTNNYWQTPAPMRMIANGTALWQLAEMYGSDKYQNFSSMSINLKSLLDIGGWFPDKVNDDSGFYWRAYFHFHGDYKVIPHFLPIYGDAVLDVNLVKTFQNQYLQLKRWAYGVEHIPFIIKEYFRHTEIDFWDKTDKLLFAFWGYVRWGSLALFVTFGGLLIPIVNPNYRESVIAINLPIVSSWILTVAFLGLFVTIYIHEKTVPPRPKDWSLLQTVWSYLQFLLIPLVLVSISTIPAIDAETTLMLGKHLEYRTTNKARSNAS